MSKPPRQLEPGELVPTSDVRGVPLTVEVFDDLPSKVTLTNTGEIGGVLTREGTLIVGTATLALQVEAGVIVIRVGTTTGATTVLPLHVRALFFPAPVADDVN